MKTILAALVLSLLGGAILGGTPWRFPLKQIRHVGVSHRRH